MNYYNQIKEELIHNEIYKKAKDYSKNKNDLNTYYNVGKLIVEAQGGEKRAKYGNRLIMFHGGHIILDVRGEEKQKLTIEDLLEKFNTAGDLPPDSAILSK